MAAERGSAAPWCLDLAPHTDRPVCGAFVSLAKESTVTEPEETITATPTPTMPCGACRQILWEFGGDLEVILANLKRETGRHQLKDLLPLPFDERLL